MKISQILNNNVAIVKRGSNEIIVYSKGVAFKKKPGQEITSEEIQKTYVLDSHDKLEHFSFLLSNTKDEYLQMVNQIIAYGEEKLKTCVSDYLYLTLLDHLDFTIKRIKKNQFIKSPLSWEVKKFYPEHYQIGLYAVSIIQKTMDIECPTDEAVAIALHFINLQNDTNNANHQIKAMETVRDILAIIKYHFHINFDEDSMNYIRLVTHLQYFVTRLLKHDVYDSDEQELNNQIRSLYPEAYSCVNKIRVYVRDAFQSELTNDEETYLMLHIHRVTQREERN
ncbi:MULTISPECIES: PRD domain-containing protein [Bacillota]|jgi:beta-glucoside operon transcriptional antiterminator|uniref:PRD domain-containing protein n=2 Tax=Amedibacillus TaxID=2749846 RepID=A0A7G9GR33_9FIRM|nr:MULTISPECIES: PRD domain-containing protein [Bacillota]QNM13265.1 PRD domain-containing protein [[Eubacterium] hominis]MCH4285470.1 PRD domain-containing protein [Amedibacillus hominis]RGB52119.1 PRD domain-containing protein [Absiella sp. AM22-9]RGB58958.1 PRD domain-containing protein [Absiella sp. AM10-20]RGB65363.1 PRD domain-containing protein [Absiella sp. AM09-45]